MSDAIQDVDSLRDMAGEDIDRLRRLKSHFLDDYAAEEKWRENKREYGRFYDGDQLTAEEKRQLEERGQPTVVINRIKPKMDAIFGIIQELAVETKAYPVGDRENEAAEISERFRQIENDSHFNEEELQVFKDMVIDGMGYYETRREWDGLHSHLITEHLPNKFVVVDKYSRRADMKDAKRVHKHIWTDLEDAQDMFPKKKAQLDLASKTSDVFTKLLQEALSQFRPDQYQQPGGSAPWTEMTSDFDQFVDPKRRRVRIVTTFYRTSKILRFITAGGITQEVTEMSEADLNKVRQSFEGYAEWTQEKKQLNSVTFCWNAILEEKKNIRPYDPQGKYSIEKCPAYITRDEEIRRPYGLVKQHLDPQREVNKRRSKMLHLLNVTQVWYEAGAFDEESNARTESVRPDGWVKYRKDFKVERITHQELAMSQFQLLQESKREIDESGVNEEIEGESRAQSGREFQLRLKEGLKSIRELMSNARAARRRVAEYWLDEILEDSKRDAKASGQEMTLTKYDVVIEEAAESVNLQSETFESLVQMQAGGMQIPPDVLIEVSPLAPKYKQKILDKWQQAGGPPPTPPPKGKR